MQTSSPRPQRLAPSRTSPLRIVPRPLAARETCDSKLSNATLRRSRRGASTILPSPSVHLGANQAWHSLGETGGGAGEACLLAYRSERAL
eukprot:scaffold51117_cov75-Phaeocystis_antarctica.AAC.2